MLDSKNAITELLSKAGITINGNKEYDIQIHNEDIYSRVIGGGSLALGESYMEKRWDCDRVDLFIEKVLRARLDEEINVNHILLSIKSKIMNMQSLSKAEEVAKTHYNINNDFFMSFLDPYNQYSCGYFKNTEDLNTAQEQKLDLICRKLQLKSTDTLLDIGCGWGGLAKYAAEKYGCHVTGITISDEQFKYAQENVKGLPVTILKEDYRTLEGKFSKIVSVGMFEHVGYKNYREYMEVANRLLEDDGLFLLHTIGDNISNTQGEPWLDKYIFPNGMLPSIAQIGKAAEKLFVMEDWHNFGLYYDKTLLAWHKNFEKNRQETIDKYGETFYRMFRYYFLVCAGTFKSRNIQLWQIVWSKGRREMYESVR